MISREEVHGFEASAIGSQTMSPRAFILVVTAYFVGGPGLAVAMAAATRRLDLRWWGLVVVLALVVSGIVVSVKSRNWVTSSVGYLLVVLP